MRNVIEKIERLEKQIENMENSFYYLMDTCQLDLYEEMDYRMGIQGLREELEELQSYL